jgi:hypothetical protein
MMSESAVRVSHPRQSSKMVVDVSRLSQLPEPIVRVSGLSQPSESAVRVNRPSQSSGSAVRVHRPCLSSESAGRTSHLEQLTTCSPNRRSTFDEGAEQSSQHTHGTVYAMPVPPPMIRPVDPRQLQHHKRPRTLSASHTFDTNDPLQEPPRKRRSALHSPANDLWTQWRET